MALLGRFCILKTMEDLVGNVVVLEAVVLEETVEGERDGDIAIHTERRKMQWTNACGSELAEIREFEPRYEKFLLLN